MKELIEHFENSGYNKHELQELERKAIKKLTESSTATATTDENKQSRRRTRWMSEERNKSS